MAIKNKNEIEIFYKTHTLSINEVAKHFNIPYRTLAHWVKLGQWQKGEAMECQEINTPEVIKNSNKVLDVAKTKLKEQIKSNLGDVCYKVDNVILNNLLESSTDEILLKTMSINFIQKNIALCAVLAKDQLMRMASFDDGSVKNSPVFIACAEKVAKIFADMKTQIYGKENIAIIDNQASLEYEKLSTYELNALLKELE